MNTEEHWEEDMENMEKALAKKGPYYKMFIFYIKKSEGKENE